MIEQLNKLNTINSIFIFLSGMDCQNLLFFIVLTLQI